MCGDNNQDDPSSEFDKSAEDKEQKEREDRLTQEFLDEMIAELVKQREGAERGRDHFPDGLDPKPRPVD